MYINIITKWLNYNTLKQGNQFVKVNYPELKLFFWVNYILCSKHMELITNISKIFTNYVYNVWITINMSKVCIYFYHYSYVMKCYEHNYRFKHVQHWTYFYGYPYVKIIITTK